MTAECLFRGEHTTVTTHHSVVAVVVVAVAGQVCGQGVSLLTSDLLLLSDASS